MAKPTGRLRTTERTGMPGLRTGHAFTDRQGHQWSIDVLWTYVGARLEPAGVYVVSADDPPVPLTAETLRRIPFGTLVDNYRRQEVKSSEELLANWAKAREPGFAGHAEMEGWYVPFTDEQAASVREMVEASRPKKGRTLTNDDLQVVADVYRTAWRQGADPRRAVAEQFHLSDSGAAKRIRAARDAGLLGQARPGKAGEV
jgi:hypothetical protein